MAKRSAETMKAADDAIIRGSNNVFGDLGFTDAEERQTKLRLAHAIMCRTMIFARRSIMRRPGSSTPARGRTGIRNSAGSRRRRCPSVGSDRRASSAAARHSSPTFSC